MTAAERAVHLWPLESEYYLQLAWAYLESGHPAAAEAQLIAADSLNSDDPRIWAARGELYALWGKAEAERYGQAEAAYRRAFESNPEYKQGVVDYANFLYKARKFDESLALIEPLSGDEDERMRFQYFLVKGRALMGKALYQEAIDSLLEGNQIYNSDTGLLNSLGICYDRIGEYIHPVGYIHTVPKV